MKIILSIRRLLPNRLKIEQLGIDRSNIPLKSQALNLNVKKTIAKAASSTKKAYEQMGRRN